MWSTRLQGKRRQPYARTEPELQNTPRGVEIESNLTFSPGTPAMQIEARGASMLHKVHLLTNGVRGGRSGGVEPNPKVKVWWIPCRGQPHMRDKSTIKDGTP